MRQEEVWWFFCLWQLVLGEQLLGSQCPWWMTGGLLVPLLLGEQQVKRKIEQGEWKRCLLVLISCQMFGPLSSSARRPGATSFPYR